MSADDHRFMALALALGRRGLGQTWPNPAVGCVIVREGRIVGRAEEARKAGQPVRADDNEESLKIRLMEYYKKTSPLIGYYYAKGQLKSVDGLGEIAEVQAAIASALDG